MVDFELVAQFPRPLTELEAGILLRILESDFEGAVEYRAQVDFASVVGKCNCGSPTIHIEIDTAAPRAVSDEGYEPLDFEGLVCACDGEPAAGIMIFSKDGYIVSMEYLDVQGTGTSEWPDLSRITSISE